jgi:hypothetical protein
MGVSGLRDPGCRLCSDGGLPPRTPSPDMPEGLCVVLRMWGRVAVPTPRSTARGSRTPGRVMFSLRMLTDAGVDHLGRNS